MSESTSTAVTSHVPGEETTLVLLPTYNELENLPRMVAAIHEVQPRIHILVIDDNSPDGTGALADQLAEADTQARIHVLHRQGKEGLGKAYIAGFKWGLEHGYDYLQQMDCDFSHRPEDLPKLLEAIRDADLVIGSRYVEGGGVKNWPWYRFLISRGGGMYARTVLGRSVGDFTGGFNGYRRKVLETLELDRVESNGYSFQIEMKWRTLNAGFRVKEVPILFVEREVGVSKMNSSIVREALLMCWKLRLGMVK
jgi:dolichol-phosphate mannosyltransferase